MFNTVVPTRWQTRMILFIMLKTKRRKLLHFSKISPLFPKISEDSWNSYPRTVRSSEEHFRSFSVNFWIFWRWPKVAEWFQGSTHGFIDNYLLMWRYIFPHMWRCHVFAEVMYSNKKGARASDHVLHSANQGILLYSLRVGQKYMAEARIKIESPMSATGHNTQCNTTLL